MSYKVLSLKLRPNQFDQIIGQNHVSQTLRNAISSNRVAHGYIFSGPRGVGKTTTARILARVLNCIEPQNNNPCDKCNNCLEIKKGNSLDVQELDGASNRGIDEMRDLREAVKYPPNNSKYRIYIIDEVHMLTREAFNALLKTLEEPPPHVIFIMATTDAHKIPPTILSRTQKFDFKHISINDISNYLLTVLEMENIKNDKEGLYIIAQKAEGSLRDALSLLDQVIAYADNYLDLDTVRDVLGIIKEDIFLKLIQLIQNKNKNSIILHLNDLIDNGYSISNFISGFNTFLRNCMIQKNTHSQNFNLSEETILWLKSHCQLSTNDFLKILELTLQFESKLRFFQHPQISLETLFLKLSLINKTKDNENLLNPNDETSKNHNEQKSDKIDPDMSSINKSESVNNYDTKTDFNANTNPKFEKKSELKTDIDVKEIELKELSLDDIKNNWERAIIELEKTSPKVANFLENTTLKNFHQNQLYIELIDGHKFQLKILEKDTKIIETIVHKILNQKIKIKFTLNDKPEINVENKVSQNTEHPLFSKVLEKFKGEIIR